MQPLLAIGLEWFPTMLFFTAAGLVAGLVAVALRPFLKLRELGRDCGRLATIIGVASPLFFILQVDVLPRSVRLILMSPAMLGLIALSLYPTKVPELRGFEVLPPKGRDPEAG